MNIPWRRLWHLVGGSFLPVFAIFVSRGVVLTTAGVIAAVLIVWEITRFASPTVNRWSVAHLGAILKPEQSQRPTGTTYGVISSFAVLFIFEKHIAIVSLFFLSIGDVMAGAVGQRYGRHKIFNKTLEGSLACLVSCLIVAVAAARLSPSVRLPEAIAGAVTATVVELLPNAFDDNLTIPIVSAAVMSLIAALSG